MKRLFVIAAALGALALPAPAMAACAGENDVVTAGNLGSAETAMACLVNEYRQQQGRSTLVTHNILTAAARAHSDDMVAQDYFSHFAPNGSDPKDRADAFGYPGGAIVGENIAFRAPSVSPAVLFADFKASPLHNSNMLDSLWQAGGYGFALGRADSTQSGVVVSQEFGSSTAGANDTPNGGGGCPKADKLAAKLKRLRKNGASKSKISKTKKALKKARKACK